MSLYLLENPVDNPRRRRRSRRNPDGTFASVGNPSRRKSRRRARRRNPATGGLVAANPSRRRRRNPFGLEKVTQQAYGVGLDEMAAGFGGLVGTAMGGEYLNGILNKGLVIIPSGQPRDFMYVVRRTIPHALAAAGLFFFAAKIIGLKRDVVAAIGVTGAATALGKAIAASDVAPQIASEGSLRLGAGAHPRALPPPPTPSNNAVTAADAVTIRS